MKRISKKKAGQLFCTALGILCVGAIFCLALIFPGYYYHHYDKNTLNRLTYTDINVNTYETSYDSFGEKLNAIARVFTEKRGLQAVRMDEIGFEMSRTDLTKIVNQELKELKACDVLANTIKFKKKHLLLYERYTLYGQSGEENFKGISFWKLVYENKKRKMTLYLDEEYQKIYYLELVQKEFVRDDGGMGGYSQVAGKTYDAYAVRDSGFYNWWDGIIRYYGFSFRDTKLEFLSSDEDFTGQIIFDARYSLMLHDMLNYDEDGNVVWKMGLLMEKMIQF